MHSSFPLQDLLFCHRERDMSAVDRNLIMHTLILHSKMKDYAQPRL